MSNFKKIVANTEPYVQLDKVSMTAAEREEAIYALQLGEEIAGAILWISNSFKRRFARTARKPGFKHEVAA